VSLMYLAYTPADELPVDEKYALATDMALAALTGEGVYNFGEVIATPVLAVLQGSPNQYLYDLVIALNQGNIDVFNSVVDSNKESYFAQDVLKNCHDQVQQKVVLLSLMNVVFELPSHERTISFTTIANVSRVPLEQVCIFFHCVPCWTLLYTTSSLSYMSFAYCCSVAFVVRWIGF
jgi:26S proteasome regulatory subunit N9